MPILILNKFLYLVDSDITNNYTFSLEYESSSKVFEVDSETGDIYNLIEGQANTDFIYVVEDPPFRTELRVSVEELSLDYIYTIKLESIKLNEIEEQLDTISRETTACLILVYWSLVEGSSTGMSEVWDVNAHVYAKDHNLYYSLTIDELNSYLQTSKYSNLVAQPFTDAPYFFETEEAESYKPATIALGCVLGFVICLLVLIYVYRSFYRSKSKKKYGTVNTLGQAYANENFKGDSESNERVENMETAFGDTSSSQKADENSSEKSNLPKIEGKDIENLNSLDQAGPSQLNNSLDQAGPSQLNNSLDQAGPSQLNQRELDNINDDSSSLTENSSEDVPKFIFPPTDDDGDLSKAETSTHSFSMENLEVGKDSILIFIKESVPPKAEIPTSSPNQSTSSLEAGETEDKTLPGDEGNTAAEKVYNIYIYIIYIIYIYIYIYILLYIYI
ncbi:hypothetical protein Avbf_06150 [Armadillidium vulgare]|nr:hypothetical protein Avbf_06150 [Armadillidium vulgare]